MNTFMHAVVIAAALVTSSTAFADDVSHADKSFLEKASNAGYTEIDASKMVAGKSATPTVKAFADQMIKDHTAVGEELVALASSKGVKVPDEPSLAQKAKIKMLSTKDGADFDRGYVNDIGVKAHQDTIVLFKKASTDAKDPDIKAWAAKTLPSLQHHLMEAQTLQKAMLKTAKNS